MSADHPNAPRMTRVDAAHQETNVLATSPAPDHAVLLAVSGQPSLDRPNPKSLLPKKQDSDGADAAEHSPFISGPNVSAPIAQQLERHARELGGQLQDQQRILDKRQAEFNAKLAKIENELRASRVQQREREIELAERETEFQARWHMLQEKATDVASAEVALQAEHQEDRLQDAYNRDQIRDALQRWKIRLEELDKSELQLQAQMSDAAVEHENLEVERRKLTEERNKNQQQIASERAQSKRHFENRRQKLQRQSEKLERRKQCLEQLHNDVSRMYREALEMRICTEELWGKLSETNTSAQVTAKVGELRRKLTDQFHLAKQSLSDQRQELHLLVQRLESQQGSIGNERHKLQQWHSRRQAEIERQAARLVAREQELDKQQASLRSHESHWDQQRRQYEQTIRELRRQVIVSGGTPLSHS